MKTTVLGLGIATYLALATSTTDVSNNTNALANITHPGKDMYVIHATVYEVGILTNRTDNVTNNLNSTGHQESVTLFHSNGTKLDLGSIPEPFLTNVTAQSLIGIGPVSNSDANSTHALSAWDQLTHPANLPGNDYIPLDEKKLRKSTQKRSLDDFFQRLFKRDVQDTTPVKIVNGAAVIPPEAGVHSISLLPLMSLNNNFSEIPVPIPNTSVVHYAKVNTLIQKP